MDTFIGAASTSSSPNKTVAAFACPLLQLGIAWTTGIDPSGDRSNIGNRCHQQGWSMLKYTICSATWAAFAGSLGGSLTPEQENSTY
jgi:hypothetical protein